MMKEAFQFNDIYELTTGKVQGRPFIFFVEGKDDNVFLTTVLGDLGVSEHEFGIIEFEGIPKCGEVLENFTKSEPFRQAATKTVVIIFDADENPQTNQEKINSHLEKLGQPRIEIGTFVNNADGVRIGMFSLPSSTHPGSLETLCLRTATSQDLYMQADDFINTAQKKMRGLGKGLNGSLDKRKAQAYIAATAVDLCRGVGPAFKQGSVFDKNHAALVPLKNFIQEGLK